MHFNGWHTEGCCGYNFGNVCRPENVEESYLRLLRKSLLSTCNLNASTISLQLLNPFPAWLISFQPQSVVYISWSSQICIPIFYIGIHLMSRSLWGHSYWCCFFRVQYCSAVERLASPTSSSITLSLCDFIATLRRTKLLLVAVSFPKATTQVC